jgi:hypothetical protein
MRLPLPKLPLIVWLILLFIFAGLLSAGIFIAVSPNVSLKSLFGQIGELTKDTNGENNIWTPAKPTPRPLAHGKQTYAVSGSKKGAPKATEVVIDPLDPAPGASQSTTVKALAMEAGPITKVSIQLITDNKNVTYPLQLTSGTNLDGVWTGSWVMEDSYDYRYQMAVIAENANDAWSVTLTFR